jgi:E3 ubiquitin-protein ligase RGLG
MGLCKSKFQLIPDNYSSLEGVQNALNEAGLEGTNLIFAIDYTESNLHNNFGQSLHDLTNENPYQKVIKIVGKTLEPFDEDKLIPAFGFGDINCKNFYVFNIKSDRSSCNTFNEVLEYYNKITPLIKLSGPTSFCPIIERAIEIVKKTGNYHILVIVTDGEVIDIKQTEEAIIKASNYPLSIITIGVGSAHFSNMQKFDDELPERKFDNFQFVNYTELKNKSQKNNIPFDILFAVNALQEIPEQYNYLKKNNMLTMKPIDIKVSSFEIDNNYIKNIENNYEPISPVKSIDKKHNLIQFQCPVCLDNKSNIVLSECGHRVCESCSVNLINKECVICRKNVAKFIKIY